MVQQYPLFDLNYDDAEIDAVVDTLRAKWISMGPKVARLEEDFAAHVGADHAIAVANCTAALHISMLIADLKPGDEVLVPSLTFVATVNAVRYVGAKPVFVDVIGPHDLCIDPVDAASKITPRTRAIVPMHYAGFLCDMPAIEALAMEHNLKIIEDAAHAPNTRSGTRRAGAYGDLSCFSFYSNKNVGCGEGGMVLTSNDDYAARARLLRSHGMTTLAYERSKGHATEYDVVDLGFNYRMDDLRAAIMLAQMDKLEHDTRRRAELRAIYVEELSAFSDITIPFEHYADQSSNYIFPIVLNDADYEMRDRLRKLLGDEGVQTSVHYPAVHRFSIYAEDTMSLPNTEYAADTLITLPLHLGLADDDVRDICSIVKRQHNAMRSTNEPSSASSSR